MRGIHGDNGATIHQGIDWFRRLLLRGHVRPEGKSDDASEKEDKDGGAGNSVLAHGIERTGLSAGASRVCQPSHTSPSGAPRPSLSGSGSPFGVNSSEMELMQYRSPVGGGPSGKTCPWCAPQRAQTISVRIMP